MEEALYARESWLDPVPQELVFEAADLMRKSLPVQCDENNYVAINVIELADKNLRVEPPAFLDGTDGWGCSDNKLGWLVGVSALSGGSRHAALWIDEREINLNDLLPEESGWVLFSGRGISDLDKNGWIHIVGEGAYHAEPAQFLLSVYMDLKNHAPIVRTQRAVVAAAEPTAVTVTAVDIDGDRLTYTIIDEPEYGDLTGDGPEYVFSPKSDFRGEDQFTITVTDGQTTLKSSSVNTVWLGTPGVNETIAVPEDYDGDGKTDEAVIFNSHSATQVYQAGTAGIFSLYRYRNKLYAGTYTSDGPKIIFTQNGTNWYHLVTLSPNPEESVYDMIFFNGWLYAGTESKKGLYRVRADGTGQELITYSSLSGHNYTLAVESYHGELFAARTLTNACHIYKSATGNNGSWSAALSGGSFSGANSPAIKDMVVFRDTLYALAYHVAGTEGGKILQWNGNSFVTARIFSSSEDGPLRAAVWNDTLWISTFNDDEDSYKARLYRWDGNASHAPVKMFERTDLRHFSNLTAYNGSLYFTGSPYFKYSGSGGQTSLLFRADSTNGPFTQVAQFSGQGCAFSVAGFNGNIYAGTMETDDATPDTGHIYQYRDGVDWYIRQSTNYVTIKRGTGANILCPSDYDGDGTADIALFDSPSGTWWIDLSGGGTKVVQNDDCKGATPVPADYDGDGIDDPATYDGITTWKVFRSSSDTWATLSGFGYGRCEPVTGDFNGDGTNDYALYDQSIGTWYVMGYTNVLSFGFAAAEPVPGDYDGDGKTDLAVVFQDNSEWRWNYWPSGNGTDVSMLYGGAYTIPVPADYDGDGITDRSVYVPDGTWAYYSSLNDSYQSVNTGHANMTRFAPADYDGDGAAEFGMYDEASETLYIHGMSAIRVGMKGKEPVPADYDGDGKTDIGMRTADLSRWHIMKSTDGFQVMDHGWSVSNKPVKGDYDGDGKDDIAIYQGSSGVDWYYYSSLNHNYVTVDWGSAASKPVQADYDGDGITDMAVFLPSTAMWYLRRSSAGNTNIQYGWNGPIPVPTDYKGDGKADLALYDQPNGTWYRRYWNGVYTITNFGWSATEPVPGDYDGDGKADLAVRGPGSVWYIMQTSAGFTTNSFDM